MKQFTLLLFVLLSVSIPRTGLSTPPTLHRWERAVCIQSPEENKPDSMKLCSAFFVNSAEQLFLVAAGHGSDETNAKSKLVYRDPAGKSQSVSLKSLCSGESDPWQRDPTSDFAIAEIRPDPNGRLHVDNLMTLSVSLQSVCTETQTPTTQIVTAGFPLGFGAKEPISPLAVVGYVASTEIQSKTRWGHEPIVYCSPAIAQGTSGGPAFLFDRSTDDVTVVGIYVGVVTDVSGAKLSKMVPSRLIHDAIANSTPTTKSE